MPMMALRDAIALIDLPAGRHINIISNEKCADDSANNIDVSDLHALISLILRCRISHTS